MIFDEYVDGLSHEHRHNPNVKEFIEYAKHRYKYPFTSNEEAEFIIAANDPNYSRNGIKKLYKEMAADRRQRMVDFFKMSEREWSKLVEDYDARHG